MCMAVLTWRVEPRYAWVKLDGTLDQVLPAPLLFNQFRAVDIKLPADEISR